MRPNSVEIVHIDALILALQSEDAILTDLAIALIGAGSTVVVEEAVQAGAVDGDRRGVDDADAPAVGGWNGIAVGLDGLVGGKLRVGVAAIVREGKWCWRVGLVVGCFGLDLGKSVLRQWDGERNVGLTSLVKMSLVLTNWYSYFT